MSCLFVGLAGGLVLGICGPCLLCERCRGENPFENPLLLVSASIPFLFLTASSYQDFTSAKIVTFASSHPLCCQNFQLHHPLPFLSRNFLVGSYYASKSCSSSSVHLMSPLARVVFCCITLCFSQCNCIQHSCYSWIFYIFPHDPLFLPGLLAEGGGGLNMELWYK